MLARLINVSVSRNSSRALTNARIATARALWDKLGPIARYCWRLPIRDFRPRMKEVLRLQGHILSAACREP
jgi:4-hydroxy-tetrahydrodipicolinate synthase